MIIALGAGILIAGLGVLFRQGLPTRTSYSRQVDDQRNAVAKPEVRDGAEEQVGQEDGTGDPVGPALVDTVPPRVFECRSCVLAPAASCDAGRPRDRICPIRGPPRCA